MPARHFNLIRNGVISCAGSAPGSILPKIRFGQTQALPVECRSKSTGTQELMP